MLELKFIRENRELVKEMLANRYSSIDLAEFDKLDENKHLNEYSAIIADLIDNKRKGSGKHVPASKLLFLDWLPDNIKKFNINDLSRPAINNMPDSYDKKILNTLHNSNFTEQCVKLLIWLDKNHTAMKLEVRQQLVELFVDKK